MISLGCALVVAVVAAGNDAHFYGQIPDGTPTFKVRLSGSSEEYYAAFWKDGEFIDRDALEEGLVRVEVIEDAPWGPRPLGKHLITKLKWESQRGATRKKRLEEGWAERGFIFIDTPSGRRPILEDEHGRALRARMMSVGAPPTQETEEAQDSPVPAAQVTEAETPGLLTLWGGHAAVLGVGLALLAVLVRFMLMEGD